MKRPTTLSPVRTTLTTAIASTAVVLFMAGSAWALSPSASMSAGSHYSAATSHGIILAQTDESTENQGVEEEQKGIEAEQQGLEEEQQGMEEEQKGMEEEHKGMEEEEEGMQEEEKNK